jgi:hypothetical protein
VPDVAEGAKWDTLMVENVAIAEQIEPALVFGIRAQPDAFEDPAVDASACRRVRSSALASPRFLALIECAHCPPVLWPRLLFGADCRGV